MDHTEHQDSRNSVLIIGGGIAGTKASFELAEAGRQVYLIDKAPSPGGILPQLDRQFPTNDCNICHLTPETAKGGGNLAITTLPLTRLSELTGQAGDFQARLLTSPRFIDVDKCTACGACLAACPEGAVRFTPGLDNTSPTCLRYPQATPQAFSINLERCTRCGQCLEVCHPKAIDLDMTPQESTLAVGAVIVATGAEPWDPAPFDEWYGYNQFADVITSLEFERILASNGPTGGRLRRPSDGRVPKRIGWIQCAGSRTTVPGGNPYCSSICCMISLKEAAWALERHDQGLDATIYFMDMRPLGRGYEEYLQRVKNELGVNLVRCRPHTVSRDAASGDLLLSYAQEDGSQAEQRLDMVVLAVGLCPSAETVALAQTLGIELDPYRYVQTAALSPVATSRPGVYACGMALGPADIPDSVVQAAAAACCASADLEPPRPLQLEEGLPPEKDTSGQEPRVGVFMVDWGHVVSAVVDLNAVMKDAAALPGVVHVAELEVNYRHGGLERLVAAIGEHGLNRVVIAGYSPRTHGKLFSQTIRRAGLNRALVEFANIRDQDALVHAADPQAATHKAMELVRMAVAGVKLARPIHLQTKPMRHDALVVGGGVAGLSAALALADQGVKVHLVEREKELGGLAKNLHRSLEGGEVAPALSQLIGRAKEHQGIDIISDALVVDHQGQVGAFVTGVQSGPGMYYQKINHGVTILATGAQEYKPGQYLYGRDPRVMTQLELEQRLAQGQATGGKLDSVVMIQCVGSRDENNPACGRICCRSAVKNALWIKEQRPESQVVVLYRDMRMPYTSEEAYRRAREAGVLFVRYSPQEPPQVEAKDGVLSVVFIDPVLGKPLLVEPEALVLSTPQVVAGENTEELCEIFRLQRGADGYLLEQHPKMAPVDTPAPGVFAAGSVLAPKSLAEARSQGLAAAGRALILLAQQSIAQQIGVAKVTPERCAACLVCVRACPLGVPFINADGYSEIDPGRCQGCGVCAAECPAKAIELQGYFDDQIMSRTDALLEGIL
ncbi:MAG: FAD-dependent oxidoreductase [Thermodesulfobacteriota bacterium]